MIDGLVRKGLVIGIMILFIGAGIVPTISGYHEKRSKLLPKINDGFSLTSLDDGLYGYWSFDEGTGNIAKDDSGNANDGTVYGASWITGVSNDALYFYGYGDYVDIGIVGTNVYTYNIWVKPDETITKDTGGPGEGNALHLTTFDYDYHFGLGDGTTLIQDETIILGQANYRTAVLDVNIKNDTWHMITLVWNSGHNRYDIYYDALLQSVVSGGSGHVPLMPSDDFEIGNDNSIYEGNIDEVRIYNEALSEAEIQELYNNPSGLKNTLIFGKIADLNTEGNFITFKAEKIRCIQFSPFQYIQYSSGENIRISEEYVGVVLLSFVFGFFKANI